MLRPTDRPDWYTIEREALIPISGVPGLLPTKRQDVWSLHRSHLPILAKTGDQAALDELIPSWLGSNCRGGIWDQRDEYTEALGFKLRITQHQAIDFITDRRGTLLGDDMRLGKTVSSIMSHDPNLGSFVVICPAMVRPVWVGWLKQVFPDEPIGVLKGRTFDPSIIAGKGIIVGHYDILSAWQTDRPIGTLVFDEAHMLANKDSWRSKAAIYLAGKAKRVICATGTPVWNMPPNLWNILSLIAPGAFGGYYEFCNRYAAPQVTAYGTKYEGISNEDELRERLTEVMIRRRWVDVAEDLPAITRSILQVELDDEQRIALDIASAAILADHNKGSTIGNLAAYRRSCSSLKRKIVVDEAVKMLARGEPVVIWTWHVDLAGQIATGIRKASFGAALITGDTPMAKRDEMLVAWRSSEPIALVCTMPVAQVGLDFSHAHLAIFAEIDYTPAILAQAEMRTYAPTRPMNITYVVVDHMVDRRIVYALTKKLAASNPLGVAAAGETIPILGAMFGGEPEEADMDRLLGDLLA